MADKIKQRRDTQANWEAVNPILDQGELGWITDRNTGKLGDGTHGFNELQSLHGVPEGWVNVRDFGAKGDGTHDDTTAIQSAIDYADNGGVVYIPNGVYKTTSTLHINKESTIIGEHQFATRILTETTNISLQLENSNINVLNLTIERSSLALSDRTYGILISNPNVRIREIKLSNIYFYKVAFPIYTQYSDGWFTDFCFHNIRILHALVGLKLGGLLTTYTNAYPLLYTYPIKYFEITTSEQPLNNIYCENITINGSSSYENSGTIGIYLQDGSGMNFNNIGMQGLSHGVVIGCYHGTSSLQNLRSEYIINDLGVYENYTFYHTTTLHYPFKFKDYTTWGTRGHNYIDLNIHQDTEEVTLPIKSFSIKSPNGSIYKVTIDDTGNIVTTLQ